REPGGICHSELMDMADKVSSSALPAPGPEDRASGKDAAVPADQQAASSKTAVASRKKFNFFDAIEKPTEWVIRLCGWSSIIGIAAIFLFIFKEAAPMVFKLNWVEFFTSTRWIPKPGAGNPASFGA